MNIKTLVFVYDSLENGRFLLTLKDEDRPNFFINHPLQFNIIENTTPEKHFKKSVKILKGGIK